MTPVVDEVRSWVRDTWSPDLTLAEWWRRLADAGLAFPTWPEGLGGRGWPAAAARTVTGVLDECGVIGPPSGGGQTMGAPTLLDLGTDAQRRTFVPALARGEEAWCQLFSEPGAGSDLAGLQTRAVRDGDRWVVTGQKVWSTGAHLADRGLLLARTDPAVPKHRGITYLVIDMDQPGVEVRPLRQMNGDADFNEVFLTEAVVPLDRVVGEVGGGWAVAQATLAHERQGIAAGRARRLVSVPPGRRAGLLDLPVGEVVAAARAGGGSRGPTYVAGSRSLVALAQRVGADGDPVLRQRLAAYTTLTEVQRFTRLRTKAAAAAGRRPGAESSTGKLAVSNLARASRDLGLAVLGAHGMLAGDDAPDGGRSHHIALSSLGASIGGGTDEIQRNVIGERTLGLPREPSVEDE